MSHIVHASQVVVPRLLQGSCSLCITQVASSSRTSAEPRRQTMLSTVSSVPPPSCVRGLPYSICRKRARGKAGTRTRADNRSCESCAQCTHFAGGLTAPRVQISRFLDPTRPWTPKATAGGPGTPDDDVSGSPSCAQASHRLPWVSAHHSYMMPAAFLHLGPARGSGEGAGGFSALGMVDEFTQVEGLLVELVIFKAHARQEAWSRRWE